MRLESGGAPPLCFEGSSNGLCLLTYENFSMKLSWLDLAVVDTSMSCEGDTSY